MKGVAACLLVLAGVLTTGCTAQYHDIVRVPDSCSGTTCTISTTPTTTPPDITVRDCWFLPGDGTDLHCAA
ncbi:MAG: hypothetical protein ACXVGB_00215 [Mycobacteriaceae bacterium]